jgi:hypothetical protein
MASPTPPSVGSYPGPITSWLFTIDVAVSDLNALDAAADAIFQVSGTVTPPGMTHAQHITLSRRVPGYP